MIVMIMIKITIIIKAIPVNENYLQNGQLDRMGCIFSHGRCSYLFKQAGLSIPKAWNAGEVWTYKDISLTNNCVSDAMNSLPSSALIHSLIDVFQSKSDQCNPLHVQNTAFPWKCRLTLMFCAVQLDAAGDVGENRGGAESRQGCGRRGQNERGTASEKRI